MTIDEFVNAYQHKLGEFSEGWKLKHRFDPEIYPLELDSASEWMEHFYFWDGNNNETN